MLESSFTFLKVRGIPIGAHWSWLLVFALVVFSLSTMLFPQAYPGLDDSAYLVMGVVTAALFFVSILLHELGHAFQALREGMRIDGITLWLFGGVARFKGRFPSAGAEFRIAIAGPAVSLALALGFGAVALAGSGLGMTGEIQGVVDFLARINGLLLIFNLVPALPLDGGRVLRAWLWHRQRSFAAATTSSARAGRAFGGLLAVVGLLNFFAGGTTGGLWLVFLGWFLVQAASAEAGMVLVQQALGNRRIRDLMSPEPDTVAPGIPVSDFLDDIVRTPGHSTYPVVEGDRPIGLVSLKLAGQVPREERQMRSVRDVMLPIDQVPLVSPDTEMLEAIDDLQEAPRRALVADNGRLVGIVSISDVARTLEIEQAVGPRRERPARRAGFLVWAVVASTMLLAAGALYHPPVVVVEPGVVIDVTDDITIREAESEAVTGNYLVTTVQIGRRNALGVLISAVSSGSAIVSTAAVLPPGIDPDEFAEQQRDMFEQSRMLAAAAAAQAVGLEVGLQGEGAVVEEIVPDSPAAQVLERDDTIVEINGREIEIAQDVQSIVRARPAGTDFNITVEREGREQQVEIRSERLPEIAEGHAGIGVFLSTRGFEVELPFEIDFEALDVGGPSAGLTYALAIADMLDEEDHARGRTIAATGEIGIRGDVAPVGGVSSKAVGAEDAGADIFFVPAPQVDEAGVGIEVRGVGTLADALGVLSQS